MLSSGMNQNHLLDLCGHSLPMHVYDKYQNKATFLNRSFSFAFENPDLAVKGCLTEQERNLFCALYADLPAVLSESVAELDSLLELRIQMCADPATASASFASSPHELSKPDLKKGRQFTERSEQLLCDIEKPMSGVLWKQLLSLDGSFMNRERQRLDFFICVMRQIWSAPSKRRVLDDLLKRFCIGRSGAISVDRMFPYFTYHQIAIHSIALSSNARYRLFFLRIPRGAMYKFIVTDNPVIDLCEEQILTEAHGAGRFLWVIAPTLAVIVTDRSAGKMRFVTEGEVAMYNALLFKKATRYVMLDKDFDFLPSCC